MADRFNILLVGHGRLGQLIAAAAPQVGATIAGTIDDTNAADLADRARWRDVDVAIDVSAPDAFVANLPALCALGCSLVVGTTGWQAHDGRRAAPDRRRRHRRRRHRQLLGRRDADGRAHRAGGEAVRAAGSLRRLRPRDPPRGQEGRAVGHRAAARRARSSGAAFRARSTSPRRGSASCPASTRSASTGRPRPSP